MDNSSKRGPPIKMLLGALLVLIGLICLGTVVFSLAQDLPLWVLGRRAEAEVIDAWLERTSTNREGELSFQYFVRYQFTAPNGRVFTRVSSVGVNEWGSLERGGVIVVVYFPLYPAQNRLDDSRFIPLVACTYVPVVFVGLAGLVVGWRLLRPTLVRSKGEPASPT